MTSRIFAGTVAHQRLTQGDETGYHGRNAAATPAPLPPELLPGKEAEKNKKVLDEILASNPVEVSVDYTVPPVSDEDLEKMMQKQAPQQMPPGEGPDMDAPDAPPAKPAPKAPAKAPKKGEK